LLRPYAACPAGFLPARAYFAHDRRDAARCSARLVAASCVRCGTIILVHGNETLWTQPAPNSAALGVIKLCNALESLGKNDAAGLSYVVVLPERALFFAAPQCYMTGIKVVEGAH
jgi:hypothetical protein